MRVFSVLCKFGNVFLCIWRHCKFVSVILYVWHFISPRVNAKLLNLLINVTKVGTKTTLEGKIQSHLIWKYVLDVLSDINKSFVVVVVVGQMLQS